MAFNWQTFRTRALTGFIFVLLMLGGIFWNKWSFLILFSIIHFACWWEYLRLTEKIHQTFFHPYTKMGLMVIGYGLMLWFCGSIYRIDNYGLKENLSLPVSAAGFALLMIGIFQKNRVFLKSFGAAVIGLLYISLSWGLMISLYQQAIEIHIRDTMFIITGTFFPITVIVSIWINDTMAYLVGSWIGKTPLTKISPKKTWEGTLGGIILCIAVVSFLIPLVYNIPLATAIVVIPIAAIAAITGTFGDIFESRLKRMANVKDSGNLMPGHGGFLDRFDSMLFATVFVWLYLSFIG